MGRAKLKMKLIEEEKSRTLTYMKRSEGLIRKMHELTTLCDVRGCMIINGPDQNRNVIWSPHNFDEEVRRLIQLYKSRSSQKGGVKTYGLSDFFQWKNEGEVATKNAEDLEIMSESQLRRLAAALRAKVRAVRLRIDLLKEVTNNNVIIANLNFNEFKPLLDMFSPATSSGSNNVNIFLQQCCPKREEEQKMLLEGSSVEIKEEEGES